MIGQPCSSTLFMECSLWMRKVLTYLSGWEKNEFSKVFNGLNGRARGSVVSNICFACRMSQIQSLVSPVKKGSAEGSAKNLCLKHWMT